MSKTELDFTEISSDLLAPGNIYWKQRSGSELLISGKGDILNYEMLLKLHTQNQVILIADAIDFQSHNELKNAMENLASEQSMREKIKWRKEFNSLLLKYYFNSERSQYDMNQLCWKIFSTIERDKGSDYLNRDRDYFKRAMSISSSYVIIAFLIGYYDREFLKNLYNTSLTNQMSIGKDVMIISLKEKLETLRKKPHYSMDDHKYIESIIDVTNFSQKILFEKFDGSGILSINMHEMSDLELVLCSLNYYYHFDGTDHKNILAEISAGAFNIDHKIINLIKRNFEILISSKTEEKAA